VIVEHTEACVEDPPVDERIHRQLADERTWMQRRIHVDVSLAHDQAEACTAAALDADGRIVNDTNAPAWRTLANPEGSEVSASRAG
jgi:hypothetical protein